MAAATGAAAAAPPAIVLPATGVVAVAAVAACGKLAQEEVRLPVTDSFFFLFSGAYRSAAASSMPWSNVCQNRSPLARRDSALSTRGEDQAYQLRSSGINVQQKQATSQNRKKRGRMSVRSHTHFHTGTRGEAAAVAAAAMRQCELACVCARTGWI